MEMLKQIVKEFYFEQKQSRNLQIANIVMFGFLVIFSVILQNPFLTVIVLVLYEIYTQQIQVREGYTEIQYFLPLNVSEIQQFIKRKATIKATIFDTALIFSCLFIVCVNEKYKFHIVIIEQVVCMAVSVYELIKIRTILCETARHQHMTIKGTVMGAGNIYSEWLYILSIACGMIAATLNFLYFIGIYI